MKLNRTNKKITSLLFAALMITSVFAAFVTPVMATPDTSYNTFYEISDGASWSALLGQELNIAGLYSNSSVSFIGESGDAEGHFFSVDVDEYGYATPVVDSPVNEVVTFPDPNLEAVIRGALGIGPDVDICRSDLERLTKLHAIGRGISDLTGLEYCTNLSWLWLGHNQITDLTPLAGLTNLSLLSLSNNQITDITPLAGLTNLTDLWLGGNQISDISPLVQNHGFSERDVINLWRNPLSRDSLNTHIPQLEGRGVSVLDLPPIEPSVEPVIEEPEPVIEEPRIPGFGIIATIFVLLGITLILLKKNKN